jgi:pyruvate dehydrogenase E2 component (dihydrolipoamide acetyltransferase)
MAEVSLRIPHIGEGLQEARLVAVLKKPGEAVKRDEPIYQMETDKAVMDVESPYDGVLTVWLAEVDTVLPIGAEIAKMSKEDSQEKEEAPAAQTGSAVADLLIPHIGEGLQEARIEAFLKKPGDRIERDEPIYQMETDKAVMDVESPYAGTLVEWVGKVDDVLAIGAVVARIETEDAPASAAAAAAAPAAPKQAAQPKASDKPRRNIPPRTRAYAKQKGLGEEELAQVPAKGAKLMPADIDLFLSDKPAAAKSGPAYADSEISSQQRILNSRMQRGSTVVVPGTMTVSMNWEPMLALREKIKATGDEFQPSIFTIFAYAAAKIAADYPALRTTIRGNDVLRTYDNLHLGIAVSLPGDELVLAVVDEADTLSWRAFADAMRAQIREARDGNDQANEAVTVNITNMQHNGIRDAVAVVVPPGMATIFLSEVYWGLDQNASTPTMQRQANLGITFDHRIMNGVGAAKYQLALKHAIENIEELVQA